MFIGSVLFRFVGVVFKWLFINIIRLLFNKEKELLSFKKAWSGDVQNDIYNEASHEFLDIILGCIILVISIAIILYLGL